MPERNPHAAARGRARFLATAESLRQRLPQTRHADHPGWLVWFAPVGRFNLSPLKILLVVVAIVLGSGSASVYAAQDTLPDNPFYFVKIWSEDVQLALIGDLEMRANQLLKLSDRRAQEIAALNAKGIAPGAAVFVRQQDEIENALVLAANLDDSASNRVLARARETLDQQLQNMSDATTPPIEQAREMIAHRLALTELGLADREEFRARVHGELKPATSPSSSFPTGSPLPTLARATPRATTIPPALIVPPIPSPVRTSAWHTPVVDATLISPSRTATPAPVNQPTPTAVQIPTHSPTLRVTRVPSVVMTPPSFPTFPVFPTWSVMPTSPNIPTVPAAQTPRSFPTMPAFPTFPVVPTSSYIPTVPVIPTVPAVQTPRSFPTLPAFPTWSGVRTPSNLPTSQPPTGKATTVSPPASSPQPIPTKLQSPPLPTSGH
ncbi:MAG: hypothetical protein HY868_08205 [Chloroflexi bacterium]|nr:hypothetical protein [Chloroflexota bacterium]